MPLSDKQQAALVAATGAIGTGCLYVVSHPDQQLMVLLAGAIGTTLLTLKEALGAKITPA